MNMTKAEFLEKVRSGQYKVKGLTIPNDSGKTSSLPGQVRRVLSTTAQTQNENHITNNTANPDPVKKPMPRNLKKLVMIMEMDNSCYIDRVREHRFHPVRKWCFDVAYPKHLIALEYEGIFSGNGKSRHTTLTGYTKDCEKYNMAVNMGWRVYRITAMTDVEELAKIITGEKI